MLIEITSPPADTKSMLDHAWLIGDQRDAFAAVPFAASTTSAADHLEDWLASNNYRSERIRGGLYVQDSQITVCLINQALDFLQKSLMNIVGHYLLAKNGLETWARITNYYASYFSVHSLLCLQGRTITRLHLDKIVPVHLVPVDLCKHIFSITTRYVGKNPHHETPWRRFYDTKESSPYLIIPYFYRSRTRILLCEANGFLQHKDGRNFCGMYSLTQMIATC